MRWDEFAQACPEIGHEADERFTRDQLVLLGTLARDGWPRISPCEVDVVEGLLVFGMMWRSPKALDLRRDPRLVVHSAQCDREATEPDLKLYGMAQEIGERVLRDRYRAAVKARIDWEPEEPTFHVFSLDVHRAAMVVFREGQEHVTTWDPDRGLRTWAKQ